MFLPCWFTWWLPSFNTPLREIPIAVALEVAANLHEWALNCELSKSAFLRTIFTKPVRVDFWISLLGFKWRSNNWNCPFLRHELDLFRYSSRHHYIWISVLRICPKFQACSSYPSFFQNFVNFKILWWWNSLYYETYIKIAKLVKPACRSEKQQAC